MSKLKAWAYFIADGSSILIDTSLKEEEDVWEDVLWNSTPEDIREAKLAGDRVRLVEILWEDEK